MDIEKVLRAAVAMFQTCHVLGMDAECFAGAIKNLKACIEAIEKAKEGVGGHDGDDGQGKNL